MKSVVLSVLSAFSTFSVLPVPAVAWRRENQQWMLGALPLVGAVIGACGYLWYLLSALLGLPVLLRSAGLTLLPVALSGGIHMDGFADTVDALSSHAPPEKKRAILKDPHAGAFAGMAVSGYFLFYCALCAALPQEGRWMALLGLTHVLSRAVGALASVLLPGSGQGGMLSQFRDGANRATALALGAWCAVALAGTAALSPLSGLCWALGAAGVFLRLRRISKEEFGGMSGDLAGYCITLGSAVLLAGLVLAERIGALWF